MQTKLFYEDEYEALGLMISNSEKSFGEVAYYLFPDRKPESAYARLKACLNPEKDERLTFGQIVAAMKFCESYEPLMFACDETLHARPDRKAAKDEEVRLVEAINGAADVMRRAMNKLDTLKRQQGGLMAFQIQHKSQIVRSARQAFEEGRTIEDYPGHMVPWMKQWQEAFRQIAQEKESQGETA